MKGVSTIIGSIIMVLIVLTIGGAAYIYSSGAYTQQSQGIEVVDSSCSNNAVTIKVRNLGTSTLSQISCIQTSPSGDSVGNCQASGSTISVTIEPGATAEVTDTCSGSGSRNCIYRLTPPTGRTVTPNVFCTA